MTELTVEGMKVKGRRDVVGDRVEVSPATIGGFADATCDRQLVDVGAARTAETPFGGTITRGFLTLSPVPMLLKRTDGWADRGSRSITAATRSAVSLPRGREAGWAAASARWPSRRSAPAGPGG